MNTFDADVIVGLQHGDCGKGTISNYMLQEKSWYSGIMDDMESNKNYDCVIKFNGGPNAGHTVYKNEVKFELHHLTAGVVNDLPVILAPACVIDMNKLMQEITQVEDKLGKSVRHLIKISHACHIISENSVNYDKSNNSVGTTGSGIGPTYSRKCLRTNERIEDFVKKETDNITINENCTIFGCEVIDFYKYMFIQNKFENVLFEGSQGFMLDIDLGDYPYVTSSNCTVGQVICNGIPPQYINNVIGVAKLYDTYVGSKDVNDGMNDENREILERLVDIGKEYGVTTGRRRQCTWLNLNQLIRACLSNGTTYVVFNKCDILKEINVYRIVYDDEIMVFEDMEDMMNYIDSVLHEYVPMLKKTYYSSNKYGL